MHGSGASGSGCGTTHTRGSGDLFNELRRCWPCGSVYPSAAAQPHPGGGFCDAYCAELSVSCSFDGVGVPEEYGGPDSDKRSQQEMRDLRRCSHSSCTSSMAAAMSAAVLVVAATAACSANLQQSTTWSAACIVRCQDVAADGCTTLSPTCSTDRSLCSLLRNTFKRAMNKASNRGRNHS